jgi:hypothetical protein
MTTEELIRHYNLRAAKESSLVRPEGVPSNLLGTFSDSHSVEAFTDDKHSVWLLRSKKENRFLLQGTLQESQ